MTDSPKVDNDANPTAGVGAARAGAALVLVEIFARAGVIDSASLHLARTLHRLRPDEPDVVLLGAALALRAPRWGHVCIEPETIATTVVLDDGGDGSTEELPWPSFPQWNSALRVSSLVVDLSGSADSSEDAHGSTAVRSDAARDASTADKDAAVERRPLVWDGTRLYLQRYWNHEARVADRITARMPAAGASLIELPASLDDLFPEDVASQRRAAVAALTQPLTVITGGPGTGKTHTIAGVVAALLEPVAGRTTPPQIALAAPTGKAAQRLTEAVQAGRKGASETARSRMRGLEATTMHRLLGARRGSFLHDQANPMPFDVVIVDEMSMVSLPLMASLLSAVRADARLVLVGDPDQLASVEAGSVLRDLVSALPARVVTPLDQVFRQADSSPIIPFAAAIQAGNATDVLALLDDPATPLRLVDPEDPHQLQALVKDVAAHARGVLDLSKDPLAGLQELNRLRVLTANRQGLTGRSAWNARIESQLGRRTRKDRSGRWYRGRPIIVTENDYLNRLMNGDIGLAVPSDDGLAVAFVRGDDVMLVPPTRLQAHDSVWAMTIHKSQGSEFDEVIVTLPAPPSPLLTRELLYTAVTRARERVVILASRESLLEALQHSISRSSGLAAQLRERGASPLDAGPSDDTGMEQLRLWD